MSQGNDWISSLVGIAGDMAAAAISANAAYDASAKGMADQWSDIGPSASGGFDGTSSYAEWLTAQAKKNDLLRGSGHKQGEIDYMRAVTGSGLTNAQIMNNQFNAEQAQLGRDFQENAMKHQVQWRVEDAQAAGVNPYFAMNGGATGVSASTGGAASAPQQPGGFDAGVNAIGPILSAVANLKMTDSEIRRNDAAAARDAAQAQNIEITNMTQDELNKATLQLWKSEAGLNETKIGEVLQNIRTGAADEALKLAGVSRTQAEESLIILQCIDQNISNQHREKLLSLQERLMSSEISVNSVEYNKIQAEIGQIYAETLTESYKQGNLSADTGKKLMEQGLIGSQMDAQEINNKYLALQNKAELGVKITAAIKNGTSAARDLSDMVSDWIPAPGKVLRGIFSRSESVSRNFNYNYK